MDIDNRNIYFYPFTEPILPSTIKETTPVTRLAANSSQSENGMIRVLIVFLKEIFEQDPDDFEKSQQITEYHEKLPSKQRVLRVNIDHDGMKNDI